ncbi:hypothetical protein [Streptomyces sp. NRRL F-5630]|uniref:hypothetical protein n=1 Tax=Streptomyces sp. NRRL F-5630 TaxID=1463864 RepID=UPI003D73CF77
MTDSPAADLRDRIRRAVCEAEGFMWNEELLEPDEYGEVADAVLAVLPTPAVALPEVWTVWREGEPVYAHYATKDAAKLGTIDCWREDEPACPEYSWPKDGPRLELMAGDERTGIYVSRYTVYDAPAPADRAAMLRTQSSGDGITITANPDGEGVILSLPSVTYLDTAVWAVEIGLTAEDLAALRDAVLAVLPAPADRAAVLTDAERAMLTYALDQAQEHIWSREGFTDEDQVAVDSLRRLTDETPGGDR